MDLFSNLFRGKKLETGMENIPAANVPKKAGSGSFQVQDVYQITGVGLVPVGKVLGGTIIVGQSTLINGKRAEIKSIEAKHKQLQEATTGLNIGIFLSGVQKSNLQRGMILEFS